METESGETRGVRNNNPLNIRITNARWIGRVDEVDQLDKEYLQFTAPVYGIRAAFRVLKTYREKYGLNTVRKIISRWAPDSENPTENYIRYVSRFTGYDQDAALPFDQETASRILRAMIYFENGRNPYADSQLNEAWALANE